nr:MAG: rep protein [Cressdnaviricota sp.]
MSAAKKEMRARQWFLTYPQCPLEKELVLKLLEPLGIKEYVIAEEKHQNGDPHVHCYIKLKSKVRFKPNYFDLVDLGTTYHGNYQSVRNYDNVVAYCTKEENYISNVDVKARKEHRSKLLPEDYNKDALDLLDEGKIGFMQLKNFLKNQDCYRMLKNKRERPPETRPEKKRHIYIYGESNAGKTCFREKMMNTVPGGWFQIPLNNDDWTGYNGEVNLSTEAFS